MVWKGRTSNSVYIVISHSWFQRRKMRIQTKFSFEKFWYVRAGHRANEIQSKSNQTLWTEWYSVRDLDSTVWKEADTRRHRKSSLVSATHGELRWISDCTLPVVPTSGTTTGWTQVWSKGGVKCVTAILADQVWLVVFVLTLSSYIIPLWKAKKIGS